MRNTQITLSSAALQHNLGQVKQLAPHSRVLAMVKANAYGHGTRFVVPALAAADGLGVASLAEAKDVIQAGCRQQQQIVLIEGVFSELEWAQLGKLSNNQSFGVVIHQPQQLAWACAKPLPHIPVWLKINTGMNRLGWLPENALEAARQLTGLGYSLILMTHFANADQPDHPHNALQTGRFNALKLSLQQAGIHCASSMANSAAIHAMPQCQGDWVRPGIMLYGGSPFGTDLNAGQSFQTDLKPVMTFEAPLICSYPVQAGAVVGYGSGWQAGEDTVLGVVAAGYGDGYPRGINHASVYIDGHTVPVIGRVSMDMLTIDLTSLAKKQVLPKNGSMAELWGEHINIDQVASQASTISYELMCRMTNRPLRTLCK